MAAWCNASAGYIKRPRAIKGACQFEWEGFTGGGGAWNVAKLKMYYIFSNVIIKQYRTYVADAQTQAN